MNAQEFTKNSLAQGSYTIINKHLMRKIGLDCTYMLQYLLDLQTYVFEGEFYQQQERLAEEFGWTVYKVQTVTKQLAGYGLLRMKRRGMPAKIYYSINNEQVIAFLDNKLSVISSENIEDKSLEIDIHNTIETPITSNVEIKEQVMWNLGVKEHTNLEHPNKQPKEEQPNLTSLIINGGNTSAETRNSSSLRESGSKHKVDMSPEEVDRIFENIFPETKKFK